MEYPEFYSYVNDLPAGQKTSLRDAMGVTAAITTVESEIPTNLQDLFASMKSAMSGDMGISLFPSEVASAAGTQAVARTLQINLATTGAQDPCDWFNATGVAVSGIVEITDSLTGSTAVITEEYLQFINGVATFHVTSASTNWTAASTNTVTLKTLTVMGYTVDPSVGYDTSIQTFGGESPE